MQMRFAALGVFVFLSVQAAPVMAAGVDARGAERLKQDIQQALDWRLKLTQSEDQGLYTEGDISVVPQGAFYAVTLPKFYIKTPKGGKIDIGTVKANVSPGANDDEWIFSAALPSPMTFNDPTGKPAFLFAIGQQKMSAVWHPKADFFPAMDATYKDITIETPEKGVAGKIGLIRTVLDLKNNGDGTWSGPQVFEMSHVSFLSSGEEKAKLTLEKATGRTSYEKIDVAGSMKLRRNLLDMATANPPAPAEDIKKMLREQSGFFKDFADGVANTGQLHNFAVTGQKTPGETFELKIGNAGFSFDLSGIRAEKATALLTASLANLSFKPLPDGYAGIVPHDFTFKAAVKDLPIQKIVSALISAATSTAAATQTPEKAPLELQQDVLPLMDLPQTLALAGTRLDVSDTGLVAPDLHTTLAGHVLARSETTSGAVADFTLAFKGLDALVTKLNSNASTPGAGSGLLGMLTPIQMMGTQGTASDGTPTRSYRFELTPEGKFLMNGTDIAGMKALLMPKSQSAPESVPAPDSPTPPL